MRQMSNTWYAILERNDVEENQKGKKNKKQKQREDESVKKWENLDAGLRNYFKCS